MPVSRLVYIVLVLNALTGDGKCLCLCLHIFMSLPIPACPNLMCLFNRGNTKVTNSLKMLCLMFAYVLYVFVSGLMCVVFFVVENLWFHDFCAE